MVTKETNNMMLEGLECLRKAVREELRKKALLGYHAIISRNGKACRVPAAEALAIADRKK